MDQQHWAGVPYLDVLRPQVGWETELALISAYSADVVAITAALLAASGLDEDERQKQSSIIFAKAYEEMRGKFFVLAQSARVTFPKKYLPLVPLLDKLIVPMECDERKGSWHPKVIVVRLYCRATDQVKWRFWLGSRNLTSDISWDTGLVLRGFPARPRKKVPGKMVPGLSETVMWLLKKAGRFEKSQLDHLHAELSRVMWEMPEGVVVESISHSGPDLRGTFPDKLVGLKELLVVSPFLDKKGVEELGGWGNCKTRRTLVSTQTALKKVATGAAGVTKPFAQILWLDAPELGGNCVDAEAEEEGEANPVEGLEESEEVLQARGLHAKIIMATHDRGTTLWLGSSNATSRGWEGRNFEINARMSIKPSVIRGLRAFTGLATEITEEELSKGVETDQTEELLEKARTEVAAKWKVKQTRGEEGTMLSASTPPHPANKDIALDAASITSCYCRWPDHAASLRLPFVPLHEQSELLKIKLTLNGRSCEWLQHTPHIPPLGEDRDRAAIAQQLTARDFLSWIKAILEDGVPDAGADERSSGKKRHSNLPLDMHAPTLEAILKAWGRNPELLREVDVKVKSYINDLLAKEAAAGRTVERDALREFVSAWEVVKKGLLR